MRDKFEDWFNSATIGGEWVGLIVDEKQAEIVWNARGKVDAEIASEMYMDNCAEGEAGDEIAIAIREEDV